MALDFALVAAVCTGLAVASLYTALVPQIAYRRSVERSLRAMVPTAGTVARPAAESAATPSGIFRILKGSWVLLLPITLGVVCLVLTRSWVLALAAVFETAALVTLWGHDLTSARKGQLIDQTLPTVLRMSATLRAGASLGQAMEAVAADGPSPTREEFRRALQEVESGLSLDDALDRLAGRIGTEDYQALSVSLTVQRRVGGNLAQVLDSLADTARQRIRLRQQVGALTAQQRLSTWILMLLPMVIAAFFLVVDSSFLAPLVATSEGHLMLLVAGFLQLCGSFALRQVREVQL
jgi:tight adherence protein B